MPNNNQVQGIGDSYASPTGRPGYRVYSKEMREWIKRPDCKLTDYDKEWFSRLDTTVNRAWDLTTGGDETQLTDDLMDATAKWKEVSKLLTERKLHYAAQGKDITKPDYDTIWGDSPLDGLSKATFRMCQEAANKLGIICHYRDDVFPSIFYKYLEDIAEAAVSPSKNASAENIAAFNTMLKDHNEKMGFEDADPITNAQQFLESLQSFLQSHGASVIGLLDPALGMQLQYEEQLVTREKFPYKPKTKNSKMVEAVYPNVGEELGDAKFDRILASWSITAHAMPNMTDEEIKAIWRKTDELLKPNGIATFYPIGHYGNSREQIEQTLQAHASSTGSLMSWEFHKSGDERFPDDDVLVLKK
jgi:hypothetical protein